MKLYYVDEFLFHEDFDEDEDADDERGGPTVVPPKPGDSSRIPVVMIPDSDGKQIYTCE